MNYNNLVSVIITTKNEEKVVKRLLESVVEQSYKRIEIILVDNDSSDATPRIARRFTNKVYNFGPERSAQRNFGAKVARGEYFLFVDADMQLSKKVIQRCVEEVKKDKNIGAIVIPEISEARTFWEKVKGFERSFYNEKGDPVTDAARFFTKKAFRVGRGYDEGITGPEDWDLPETLRELGFKIGKISERISHIERISSLIALARKKFYYGLYAYKYLDKHNIGMFGPKTIYFLRPVFYKNLDKIIMHPVLSIGMVIMLSAELIGGGLGFFVGRTRKL